MNESDNGINNKNSAQIDFITPAPRFSVKNSDELNDGVAYLRENGYTVFRDVLNQEEIKENKDLLWKYLESASNGVVRRGDPNTWPDPWPSYHSDLGIINGSGIGQSDFLWNVRSNRQIKHIFARIWNTSQLLVSFDGCGIFRDWSSNPTWKTKTGWYHVDQNPKLKPNPCCIQSLVALTDQNEKTGGLIVFPRSHLYFTELCAVTEHSKDFIEVPNVHSIINQGKIFGKLIHCQAGDLVAWDSRTIHCNSPAIAIEGRPKDAPVDLLRIVAYVSMSPTSFVNDQKLEQFREKRKEFVENNCTTTHWSTELVLAGGVQTDLPKISLDKFTPYQKALIFGWDHDNNNSE